MSVSWNSAKMADVFNLQMGKTPDRSNAAYWNGSETWVAIGDMGESRYISSSKELISTEAVSASGIKRVPLNTVIMSFKLSVGKVAIAASDLFTNEAIMAFLVKTGYDLVPEYIYYYLKGYKWQGSNRAVMGVTLNKASISQGIFKYPDYQEQKRIVAELDLLTEVIDKRRMQLTELDTLAQSIFYDMFGDPTHNEKGWDVKKWEKVFRMKSGDGLTVKDFINGVYPVYGGNGISGFHNAYNKDGSYIVIGRVGAYCGNVRFVQGKFWLTDNAFELFFDSKSFNFDFLCRMLNTYDLHQYANQAAQPVISNTTLKGIDVILPPLTLQQEFADKIQSIEKQKAAVNQSIADTQKLLDYTMDKYFG